jgi:CHAD domain-containing protein
LSPDGTDFLLARGTSGAAVAGRIGAVPGATATRQRTYFDTFDGRLRARGLTLALEDGRLTLGGARGPAADVGEERRRILVADLPPGPLRDALGPVLGGRAALPTATVTVRSEPMRVLDGEGKTVVRLAAEAASLRVNGHARRLDPRLSVRGVRGYDSELAAVVRAVERELALPPATRTLADEAVVAGGGRPGGTSSRLAVELEPDEPAGIAAARVLAHLLATIEANLPGTLADLDTEFLHDLRIAVRRTRSVQRQLAPVFPPAPLARFRAGFRRLQQATGPARDLDVQLLEFDELAARLQLHDPEALEPLRAALTEHREREWQLMAGALDGARMRRLLKTWPALLERLPDDSTGLAAQPIAGIAGRRIVRVHHKLMRMGAAIDDASPAESLHELRKTGKELRYLLEIFGGLFPDDAVKPLVRSLKRLQDTLGRHQDRAVQVELLNELRDDVAARPGGAAALMAMGALAAELVADQAAARGEFADRFAGFADRRRHVRKTFG